MKPFFLFLILLFTSVVLSAQPALSDSVFSKVTTKQAKEQRYKFLVDTTIKQYLADSLNDDNEGEWNEALWSMELLQYKDEFTKQKLDIAWSNATQRSDEFQKKFIRDYVFFI